MRASVTFGRTAAWTLLTLAACRAEPSSKELVEPVSKRGYRVIEPAGHDTGRKAPVLFALHAYATPSEMLVQSFSLADEAGAQRGFLVVVPEGTKDTDGQPYWNASRA